MLKLAQPIVDELSGDDDREPPSLLRPEVEAIFDKEALKVMQNQRFTKVLANKYARKEAVHKLASEPAFEKTDMKTLDFLLENCDRDIFQKLRNGEITADQLPQRIVERKFGLKYKPLDDVKKDLPEQYYLIKDPEREKML